MVFDRPEDIYGLGVICDGILLCQKCTFTCNGFICRQDVDALGAFVLSHAIMTHSFFIPFNPWRPLWVCSLSLLLPLYFLIAHFRWHVFLMGSRLLAPILPSKSALPKSNPNELLEYSKYSTQIQYRAYFMCLYSKASIIIWHKCRCVHKEG